MGLVKPIKPEPASPGYGAIQGLHSFLQPLAPSCRVAA
ncbi:hypothetical protein L581_1556 [Serratia fonticola AU-AP2C]|nr:hypothetical protein L581_1556 [Serratia fonticola AU-AP2C]